MKYPYIGKAQINSIKDVKDFDICLFSKVKSGAILEDNIYNPQGYYSENWNEGAFKNITAEYLANTYGEVKSKEHAEFIVKLCEGAGIDTTTMTNYRPEIKFFNIHKGGDVTYLAFWDNDSACTTVGEKQITIPLPPECDERKPKEVIANGKKHTLNSVTGFYDFSVIDLGYATVSTLEKLKMADDYQVISFVDDASVDSDWPEVNDVVVLGEKKGIVKLPPDAQGYYIVDVGGIYNQCKFGELEKPKASEQELNEELYLLLLNNCYSVSMAELAVKDLIDKYSITKKPQ